MSIRSKTKVQLKFGLIWQFAVQIFHTAALQTGSLSRTTHTHTQIYIQLNAGVKVSAMSVAGCLPEAGCLCGWPLTTHVLSV